MMRIVTCYMLRGARDPEPRREWQKFRRKVVGGEAKLMILLANLGRDDEARE